MRARDLAHEQYDAHDHQARSHHCRRAADDTGERLAHHTAAGRDDHEQERAVQLSEQAPPFLARIIKILNPLHDALLYCSQYVGDDAVMGVALVSAVFVLICRHGCPPPQGLAMWSAVPSLGLPPQKANVPLTATVVSAPRV